MLLPKLTSPLKYPGGKHYLADMIITIMPPHEHYIEPFAGSLAVLIRKPYNGISEVVNDLDRYLTDFWITLSNTHLFADFVRIIDATPFSSYEFEAARDYKKSDYIVRRAVQFFIRNRMSRQGEGREFTSLTSARIRRGMNAEVSAWLTAVDGLAEIHARLRQVLILNMPALDVINKYDGPKTLFYCDPPYLDCDLYEHGMSEEDHIELLESLSRIQGHFILSGYNSPLYEIYRQQYKWHVIDIEVPNSMQKDSTKSKKIERLWTNFDPLVLR